MKSARPFHVSTVGLSPDLKRAHPAFGTINRGDVSRQILRQVLEVFRELGTTEDAALARIVIQAETGGFTVRVAAKQLSLIAEGQPSASAVPLATDQIIKRLEQPLPVEMGLPKPPPEPISRSVTSLVLLCAGVALIAQALMRASAPGSVQPAKDITLIVDRADLKARQDAVTGIFATGQQAGDRLLTITPDGLVAFAEIGPRQSLGAGADNYRIGRRNQQTCLVTTYSGVIEASAPNTLVYYGDTYRRIK
jgi:hypothetical protein